MHCSLDMAKIDMAEIDMQLTRLLGFAPVDGLDTPLAAMRSVPGPELQVYCASRVTISGRPRVAVLFQTEPDVPLLAAAARF
jgi:hypothetical protein